MADFRQKTLIWLTIFLVCLASVCAKTHKPTVKVTSTHASTLSGKSTNTTARLTTVHGSGNSTTPHPGTIGQKVGQTSMPSKPINASSSIIATHTTSKPTTTSTPTTPTTATTPTTSIPTTTTTPTTTSTPTTTTTPTTSTPTTTTTPTTTSTPTTTTTQASTSTPTTTTTTTATTTTTTQPTTTTTTTTPTTTTTSTSTRPTTTPTAPSTQSSTVSNGGTTPASPTAKSQGEDTTQPTTSKSNDASSSGGSTGSPQTTTEYITTTTELDNCAGGDKCQHNGTCHSTRDNYTCECTPGWQGWTCAEIKDYCKPAPCKNNGRCTQNLTLSPDYYTCECAQGFTGPTCEADAHECDNATLCGHGICAETFGSYDCYCYDGWNGDFCQIDIDECESQDVCPEYHHCNNTEGGYECTCDDPLEYIDNVCRKSVLWPDFKNGSEFTWQTVYDARTAIPFPYYESASRDLYVFKYGYVAFGRNILSSQPPFVPSQWPYSTKLFGVYWADIEATNSSTNPSHFYISLDEERLRNYTHTSTLITYVKGVVNDSQFAPISVLAATWVNAVPSPAKKFPNDRATFQVIIATDGQVTYAISGYRTVWANTNVFDRPFVQTAHSLHIGAQSNVTTPSNETGPVVVKLVEGKGGASASFACVYTTQKAIEYFGGELQSLPACPCHQAQAVNDDRFEAARGLPSCYQNVIPSPVNKLFQLCCFDDHGFLLNFTRDALAPLPVSQRDMYLKQAHDACCNNGSQFCGWFYSQLSLPGCGEYVPPSVGGGFGDPHIVTIDGNKYSFNDLGDFVLFKSGVVEFQGRTNISSSGKTTVFVAYALKDEVNTYKFYPQDNSRVLRSISPTNTSLSTNLSLPEAIVRTSEFIVKVRSQNSSLSYQITLLSSSYPDSKGLLGSADRNASNDFTFQDGTLKEGKAEQLAADIINQFAGSWRVEESLSLFGDSLTYANFTAPNLTSSPDEVLLQIYEHRNRSGYDEAKQICGEELFCLQDYLIEGNAASARDTLEEATDISIHQNISTEFPVFKNTQRYFQVNISHLLNVTLTAATHSNATFSVSGNLSNIAGFKLDGDQVTWNISANLGALRNASYPQDLVFYVTDAHNLTAKYAPLISLCLCAELSQCSVEPTPFDSTNKYFLGSDGTTTGNVGSWVCDCDGRAEGDFCEIEINVCDNCFVKNHSLCDTALDDYCPACPAGYGGNTFLCPDINECLKNNGGCGDICRNTDGSFTCDCREGYSLNDDGKSCSDVNECLDPEYCPDPEKFCVNDQGSAHCSCYPGLVGNETCKRAPFVFYGTLGLRAYKDQAMSYALLVKSSPQFKALAEKVTTAITDLLVTSGLLTAPELYIEVLSFENATATIITDRAKRDTNIRIEAYTVANFLIHSTNISVNYYAIRNALASGLHGCDSNCQLGQLLLFSDKNPALDDKDPCTRQEVHHCDLLTTECFSNHIYHFTQCNCKPGFTKFEMNFFSCYDVDECADDATLCGSRKGACINLPGSYECACDKGQVWDSSAKACVGDKCSKNPCENDGTCFISNNEQGFVCSCTFGWNGPVCGDEDTDARRVMIAVICVSAILGFCCLALFIILVVVCVRQRRNAKKTSRNDGYSVVKPTTHRDEMGENGRGNVYSSPSFERSGDKRTSFNSPEAKKEGHSNTYYNKAFDNDVVARL